MVIFGAWLMAALAAAPAHADPPAAKMVPAPALTKPAPTTATPTPAAPAEPKVKRRRKRKRKPRRGGIAPCMTPDPGWGFYDGWSRRVSMGQMTAPQRGGITKRGGFDLVVHFHGHYPIRKEFVKTARGQVLVAIDLGVSSGPYSRAFGSPDVFEKLLESVKREMARRHGREKTYIRRLALTAWSAGYGAIEQILQQPAGRRVDAVVLLDSVHTGYRKQGAKDLSERLNTRLLKPWVKYAKQAARGRKFLFQSYSSIQPPGYASTKEVGRYMVKQVGGKVRRSRRRDVLGLDMTERYDRRGYHVRGYTGNDKPDHCAHLGLMKDVMKVHLNRRWRSPRGRYGRKGRLAKEKPGREKVEDDANTHRVASGEHLTGIARKYGVSVGALRRANRLDRGKALQIGQRLRIPKSRKKPGKQAKKQPLRAGERMHVVAEGQSLGRIAKRYHVSVAAITKANGLSRRKPIRPGQRLRIPPSRR